MNSFLKTYGVVLGILFGIFAFFGLLVWGLTQLIGEWGPLFAFAIFVILALGFAITCVIENGQ